MLLTGFLGQGLYTKVYGVNTTKEGFVYLPTNSQFKDVENLLRPFLKRVEPFVWLAEKKNYPNTIKAGKYLIAKGMNNNELINLLRSGQQTVVNLSFNNQHSLEKLAGRISTQIEADSSTLVAHFTDKAFLSSNGFSKNTALAMYLPNTYQCYWNISAVAFRDRMLAEYNRFWNPERLQQAKALNLSNIEVITLAAIVQKETTVLSERPIVAGLYLNRLKRHWPLQADPTVIFALRASTGKETPIRRVLTKDLGIRSPYNTYLHKGLPPGPIAMPDISAIDAVLQPTEHDYFYMCASVTDIGKHVFSKRISEHNRNAVKYQSWLNKQGIKR